MNNIVTKPGTGSMYISIANNNPSVNFSTIEVFAAPTANCQLWSIGYFNSLIDAPRSAKGFGSSVSKEELQKALTTAWNSVSQKKLLFIDVNQKYQDTIKTWFKGLIVIESPYISTNRTPMVLFLIKTENESWLNNAGS